MIIGLQLPTVLEKWIGEYSNSGKKNHFYIAESSSRNSEISEINEADFVLWFLQKILNLLLLNSRTDTVKDNVTPPSKQQKKIGKFLIEKNVMI